MIYKEEIEFLQRDTYDLLIVGAGTIGLSLASSLSYENISICVVESGFEEKDTRSTV